jgi:hypothetical protein
LCGGYLARQVASAASIFSELSPVLSVVKKAAFTDNSINRSLVWRLDIDSGRRWRELLRPFTNVKAIHVEGYLVDKISHSSRSDQGGPPLEIVPNLQDFTYFGGYIAPQSIRSFIDERRVAGRFVREIFHPSR